MSTMRDLLQLLRRAAVQLSVDEERFRSATDAQGANFHDAANDCRAVREEINKTAFGVPLGGGEAAPTALNVMGLAPKLYGDKYALGSVLFFVASDVPAGEIHLRDGHDGRLLGKIINVGEYVPPESK